MKTAWIWRWFSTTLSALLIGVSATTLLVAVCSNFANVNWNQTSTARITQPVVITTQFIPLNELGARRRHGCDGRRCFSLSDHPFPRIRPIRSEGDPIPPRPRSRLGVNGLEKASFRLDIPHLARHGFSHGEKQFPISYPEWKTGNRFVMHFEPFDGQSVLRKLIFF